MYKYILLLLLLILQACSKPLPEYLAKKQLREDFKKTSNASCPLGYLDNKQDILVASIYFKTNNSSLSKADKNIIKDIATIHQDCAINILLVGHSSSVEEEQEDLVSGVKLSFERVKEVTIEMKRNKILGNYINVSFCGSSNNLVDENQKNANLYNQRVDIVFLNNPVTRYEFGCIPTITSK